MWAASFPRWSRPSFPCCWRWPCAGLAALSSCTGATHPRRRRHRPRRSRAGPPDSPAYDAARATLARLPVKGWDRNTDFSRYRFGEAWSDDVNVEFGHNGCNTRDDILRRDLADLVVRARHLLRAERRPARPVHRPDHRVHPRARHLRCRADRPPGVAVRRLVQGRPRMGRSASPRLRQRSAQPACRRREGQLRQGFSRCDRLAAAQRRRSAASSSRARSTSRPPTGCGCPGTRSGRWQDVLARC